MPCPPGYTTYHAIPLQAIPYTMQCPPDNIIYHAISRQSIPYDMPCPACNIIYHAKPHQAIPYTMPYRAHQTIIDTMPHLARPIHIPCDAHQAIPYTMRSRQTTPYTMPRPLDHTMSCPPKHVYVEEDRQNPRDRSDHLKSNEVLSLSKLAKNLLKYVTTTFPGLS